MSFCKQQGVCGVGEAGAVQSKELINKPCINRQHLVSHRSSLHKSKTYILQSVSSGNTKTKLSFSVIVQNVSKMFFLGVFFFLHNLKFHKMFDSCSAQCKGKTKPDTHNKSELILKAFFAPDTWRPHNNQFLWSLFITATKVFAAQESRAQCERSSGSWYSNLVVSVISRCKYLALVSAHQAARGAFMNSCVRKSPSGDEAMCVIPQISLLSTAKGDWERRGGTQRGDSEPYRKGRYSTMTVEVNDWMKFCRIKARSERDNTQMKINEEERVN